MHRTFDNKSVGILEGEPLVQEGEDALDTSDADEDDAEDECQILNLEGEKEAIGAASSEEDVGASTNEEDCI
jgi:hypothetical protein